MDIGREEDAGEPKMSPSTSGGLRKGREKHVTDIPEAQDLMPAVRVMLAGLMRH